MNLLIDNECHAELDTSIPSFNEWLDGEQIEQI